jgi:hypothetical protein
MSDSNLEDDATTPAEESYDDMPLKGVPLPNPPVSGPDGPVPGPVAA